MTDQEYKEQCAALLAEVQDLGKRAEAFLAEIRAERQRIAGQNDPHKHPLYRPHHGDMNGYRFLESDELPNETDDWVTVDPCGGKFSDSWTPCGPDPVNNKNIFAYRRRVTPEDLAASSDSPSRTAQTIPPAGPLRAEPCDDAVTLKGAE